MKYQNLNRYILVLLGILQAMKNINFTNGLII